MDKSTEAESIRKLSETLNSREKELQTDLEFLDNNFMSKYLRACEYDIDNSANAIIKYFNFRARHPEWFRDHRDTPSFLEVFKSNLTVMNRSILNTKNGKSERVLYQRTDHWNVDKFSIEECIYAGILQMEYYALTDNSGYGLRQIQSCTGITFAKMWKVPMPLMKEMNEMMETAMPVRVTGINVTDVNGIFLFFFKIFQAFISAEMKARISMIGSNYEELLDHCDRACIPSEMGGDWNVADDEITDDKAGQDRINLMCDTVVEYWSKTPVVRKE